MPKIRYEALKLGRKKLALIAQANTIIAEYAQQGFDLTLRQLYYQFVARDIIPNNQKSYQNLGTAINDGRMAGLIDWYAIVDRTRYLRGLSHWSSPSEIVEAGASTFRVDRWATQPYRVEVWIEKDALVGVIAGVCNELDVPFFSCRGYTSQSEMWLASQRLLRYQRNDQTPIVLHFGDHDPSGMDMTRDIGDRLTTFMGGTDVRRLALNMAQVEEFKPPPNFAKTTDARAKAYIREFGSDSWELDALDPKTISGLIREEIRGVIDEGAWSAADDAEERGRHELKLIAENYRSVTERLRKSDHN